MGEGLPSMQARNGNTKYLKWTDIELQLFQEIPTDWHYTRLIKDLYHVHKQGALFLIFNWWYLRLSSLFLNSRLMTDLRVSMKLWVAIDDFE